jgi:hypothetical protein
MLLIKNPEENSTMVHAGPTLSKTYPPKKKPAIDPILAQVPIIEVIDDLNLFGICLFWKPKIIGFINANIEGTINKIVAITHCPSTKNINGIIIKNCISAANTTKSFALL